MTVVAGTFKGRIQSLTHLVWFSYLQYCECYAGNVKCSANCRCMGCKNVGGGNFEREPNSFPVIAPHPRHPVAPPQLRHLQHLAPPRGNEPWLAAQNLTFLKRGSPDPKKKLVEQQQHPGEITSMPSLASSSEGTSPADSKKQQQPEDEGAQALLLAAMAMTEFGQSPAKKRLLEESPSTPKRLKTVEEQPQEE
jgi:hypothetical protein